MSEKQKLEGKNVSLFLVGGWEVSGVVAISDQKKIIIENDEGMFMVFKDKVSCLSIYSKESARPVLRPQTSERSNDSISDEDFPMNPISYEDTGMSLPGGILGIPDAEDEDFSMQITTNNSFLDSLNKKINFETDDDS